MKTKKDLALLVAIITFLVSPCFGTPQDFRPYWFGIGVQSTIDIRRSSVGAYNNISGRDVTIRTGSTTAGAINIGSLYSNTTVVTGYSPTPYDPTNVVYISNPGTYLKGISAASAPYYYPPATVPTDFAFIPQGSITGSTTIGTTGTSTYYKYDAITLSQNNSGITINGNVTMYVTGDINLTKQGANITISPGSTLAVYAGGNINLKYGEFVLNGPQDSSRLQIFGLVPGTYDGYTVPGCTSIQFGDNEAITAAVYAPYADISFQNAGTFNGAVVANSLDFGPGPNTSFNYDASLIPEPATILLLGLGGLMLRRKN